MAGVVLLVVAGVGGRGSAAGGGRGSAAGGGRGSAVSSDCGASSTAGDVCMRREAGGCISSSFSPLTPLCPQVICHVRVRDRKYRKCGAMIKCLPLFQM